MLPALQKTHRYDRVDVELQKNSPVVDAKSVYPSKDAATYADKTYCYRTNVCVWGAKWLGDDCSAL